MTGPNDLPPPLRKENLTPETDPNEWQGKVLMFLRYGGVSSDMRAELLAIVLAMLNNNRNIYPRYAYQAHIDKDGNVFADFAPTRDERTWVKRKLIGTTIVLRDMIRDLADGLDLTDAERIAMFNTLKQWCATDDRDLKHAQETTPDWKPYNKETGEPL